MRSEASVVSSDDLAVGKSLRTADAISSVLALVAWSGCWSRYPSRAQQNVLQGCSFLAKPNKLIHQADCTDCIVLSALGNSIRGDLLQHLDLGSKHVSSINTD